MNRKYGCLMGLIPDPWKSQIKNFANSIPKHHIQTEDDGEPHVTIKYGFINTPAIVFSELLGYFTKFSPIKIKTKTLSLFKGNEDGDVLILEVESKELRFLNELVGSLFPCVDKYPVYKPHITIAYLNPNYSASYTSSLCTFLNQDIEINEVEYSDADRVSTIVKLDEGKGSKTLSYLNGNLGGALVPPPEMAKKRKIDSPFRNRFVVFERDKLTKNLSFYMVKAADPPVSPAIPTQNSPAKTPGSKQIGQKWQGPSGKWFTLIEYPPGSGKHKVVPTSDPGNQIKTVKEGKEVVEKVSPDKANPELLAKSIQDVMDAEKVPLQEIKDRVFNGLYEMPLKDITEIKKQFGVKASGRKVEFAKKVADRIIDKLVAEGKINEKDVKPAEDIQETKKEEVKIDPEIAKVLPEPIVEPELKKQLEEKEEEFDVFEDEEDEEEYSKQDIKEMLDSTGASTMEEAIEIINKRIADVRREREGSRLQNTEEEKSDVEIFKDTLNQPPEKIDEINKDTTARAIALLQKEMGRDGLIPMYALVDYWADSMEGGKDVKDSIRMQIESALEELTKDDLIDPVRSRDGRITSVMFSDESGLSTKNVKPLERKPKQQRQEEPVQEKPVQEKPVQEKPVQAVEEQKPQRTMEDVDREINEVHDQMMEASEAQDDDRMDELTGKLEELSKEKTALRQGQQKPPEQATTGQQPQEQPQESTPSSSSAGEPGGEIGNEPKKEEEGVPEKPKLSPEEFQKKTQELTKKYNRARLSSTKKNILNQIVELKEKQTGSPVDRNEIIKNTKVPTVKKNVRSSTYTPDVAKQDREELLDDLIKGTVGEEAIDEYIKTISKMNALDVQKLGKELKIAGKLPKGKIIDTIRQQLRNQYEMNLKYPFQDDLQAENLQEKESTTQEPETPQEQKQKKDPYQTVEKWSEDPNLTYPSVREIEKFGYEVGQGHEQVEFEDGDIIEKVNLDDLPNTPEHYKGKTALVALARDSNGELLFSGTTTGYRDRAKRESEITQKRESKVFSDDTSEPNLWEATKEAWGDIQERFRKTGEVPKVWNLVKYIQERIPKATKEQIHSLLQKWQEEDLLTLQVINDIEADPRSSEGIISESRGTLGYIDIHQDALKGETKPDFQKTTSKIEKAPTGSKQAESDTWEVTKEAYKELERDIKFRGLLPKIWNLVDKIQEKIPGTTKQEVHDLLQKWQKEDLITLQAVNNPEAETRSSEGIHTKDRGVLGYFSLRKGANKRKIDVPKQEAPKQEQEQKQESPKQTLKKKENLPVVKKNVRSDVSTADKVKEFYDNLTEGINDKYSIDDSVTDFMDEVSKMDVLRLKELRKKLGIKGQYKNKAKTLSEIEKLANNKKNEFEKNQTK